MMIAGPRRMTFNDSREVMTPEDASREYQAPIP